MCVEASVSKLQLEICRFVLKPQREGGGNNVYGADIRETMLGMKDTKERSAWILMERIHPPITSGYVIRKDSGKDVPDKIDLISELGIFGVVIGSVLLFLCKKDKSFAK